MVTRCHAGWGVPGSSWDPKFFLPFEVGYRPHQIRLEGGDSSSDTFCYP